MSSNLVKAKTLEEYIKYLQAIPNKPQDIEVFGL